MSNTDSMNKLTACIFARGGSKGVKKKNIRLVAGKPLIAHSIESGLASKYISEIVVSTDCPEIAEIARSFGAVVLMRGPELAADDTPEVLAWRHAISSLTSVFSADRQQLFISLPATSPLRAPIDIDMAIERFLKDDCDVVFGISPSSNNPYLNMVTIQESGLIEIALPGLTPIRRQNLPDFYNITTCVYVTSTQYVQGCTRLIDGRVGYVMIPPERALDIDDEFDLYQADLMLRNPFRST